MKKPKTKEEMLAAGYAPEWVYECPFCKSWDSHAYDDVILCFTCKKRIVLPGKEEIRVTSKRGGGGW